MGKKTEAAKMLHIMMYAPCSSLRRNNKMWVTIQQHKLHMTPLWGPSSVYLPANDSSYYTHGLSEYTLGPSVSLPHPSCLKWVVYYRIIRRAVLRGDFLLLMVHPLTFLQGYRGGDVNLPAWVMWQQLSAQFHRVLMRGTRKLVRLILIKLLNFHRLEKIKLHHW